MGLGGSKQSTSEKTEAEKRSSERANKRERAEMWEWERKYKGTGYAMRPSPSEQYVHYKSPN